jgi:hypothetical protein
MRARSGTSALVDLTEGGSYTGTTSATLTVSGTSTAMSGDVFQLAVTNGSGTVNSSPVALTVTAPANPPANPPSSGGGGGGRFDLSLLLVLALCLALHRAPRVRAP